MAEESLVNSVPNYYKDSLNLNSLQYNNKISEEAKLEEVGVQFESILLRQFLDESLKNLFKGMDGQQSPGSQVYKGMIIDQLADSISRSNQTGMAKMYSEQLRQIVPEKVSFDDQVAEVKEMPKVEDSTEPTSEVKTETPNLMESVHQQQNFKSL